MKNEPVFTARLKDAKVGLCPTSGVSFVQYEFHLFCKFLPPNTVQLSLGVKRRPLCRDMAADDMWAIIIDYPLSIVMHPHLLADVEAGDLR